MARLASQEAWNIFREAVEDVELMREYLGESLYNQGIKGGLHNLEEMANTLDWEARNVSSNWTTEDAGIGIVDDREGRKVDRFVSEKYGPSIGNHTTDMAMVDTLRQHGHYAAS